MDRSGGEVGHSAKLATTSEATSIEDGKSEPLHAGHDITTPIKSVRNKNLSADEYRELLVSPKLPASVKAFFSARQNAIIDEEETSFAQTVSRLIDFGSQVLPGKSGTASPAITKDNDAPLKSRSSSSSVYSQGPDSTHFGDSVGGDGATKVDIAIKVSSSATQGESATQQKTATIGDTLTQGQTLYKDGTSTHNQSFVEGQTTTKDKDCTHDEAHTQGHSCIKDKPLIEAQKSTKAQTSCKGKTVIKDERSTSNDTPTKVQASAKGKASIKNETSVFNVTATKDQASAKGKASAKNELSTECEIPINEMKIPRKSVGSGSSGSSKQPTIVYKGKSFGSIPEIMDYELATGTNMSSNDVKITDEERRRRGLRHGAGMADKVRNSSTALHSRSSPLLTGEPASNINQEERVRLMTGSIQIYRDVSNPLSAPHPNHNREWGSKNLWCTKCQLPCAGCKAPCCALNQVMRGELDDRNPPHIREVDRNLKEWIRSCKLIGTDEPTMMDCTECKKKFCPACIGLCPVFPCHDRVCKGCKTNPWEPCDWHNVV